jgi:hypothetical protein
LSTSGFGLDVGWKPYPFLPLLNTLFEAMAAGGGGGNLVFFVTGPNLSALPFTLLYNSSITMEDLGSSSSDGGV